MILLHYMKKSSTLFLQIVLVILGAAVLAALLIEPHFEGRNMHATFFAVYYKDPFLAYVYLMSIPFFVGLYQACRVLGLVGKNQIFSLEAVKALRTIKYCAFITATAILAADAFLMVVARTTGEDAAGAVMMGIVATFASVVVGTAAAVFEKVLQNAVDIKSENDLTV